MPGEVGINRHHEQGKPSWIDSNYMCGGGRGALQEIEYIDLVIHVNATIREKESFRGSLITFERLSDVGVSQQLVESH